MYSISIMLAVVEDVRGTKYMSMKKPAAVEAKRIAVLFYFQSLWHPLNSNWMLDIFSFVIH